MGLFGAKAKTGAIVGVKELTDMVERYYKRRNLDIKGHELPADDGYGWWIGEGSAKVYIFVVPASPDPVVKVTSPVCYVPAANQERLFKRLLEINNDTSQCAISLFQDIVLVQAQRRARGLDQEELNDMIWNVSYLSDLLDDQLQKEFGAVPYNLSPTA